MWGLISFSAILCITYLLGSQKKIYIERFMDRKFTIVIKGLSIFTVLWSHVGGRFGIGGIQFVAGVGVSLFLICSGYGLEISYQKMDWRSVGLKDFLGSLFLFG